MQSAGKTKAKPIQVAKDKATKVSPKMKSLTISSATKAGDIVKFSKSAARSGKKTTTQPMSINIPPYRENKGEQYMNTNQQHHFRKILLQWKQQLLQEMNRTVHHLQDEAANFPDPNDRATQEEEFSLELRARDRERKLIKKIEEALQKIEEGEYGYCDSCGVEIGIRRLEARPTANLCIDCKTLDEIREKQMGG